MWHCRMVSEKMDVQTLHCSCAEEQICTSALHDELVLCVKELSLNQQGTFTVYEAYLQRDFRPQFMEEMWGICSPTLAL